VTAYDSGLDAGLSRFLHALNRPAVAQTGNGVEAARQAAEQAIVESAEDYLHNGVAMLRWWEDTDRRDSFRHRFELQRTFNRPDSSYGFFDEITMRGERMPIMGSVQEMLYDNPRVPVVVGGEVSRWIREQVRTFVLRYFMRISDFRQPEAAENLAGLPRPIPPPGFGRLSWCDRRDVLREGFGFTQVFYKLRGTGEVGRFPEDKASAIVDVREVGAIYDWIILKVRIFDFNLAVRPFGEGGPELVFNLNEESYLILSRDLVAEVDDPEPGVIGDYAVGYAFIKAPGSGFLAYGPGRFDAAVEVIRFRVLEDGQIRVHMLFVANRPASIASVSLDPIDWAIWSAEWLTGGSASKAFRLVYDILDRRPFRIGTFDPVYTYVSIADMLTGGQAAERLCISRDALDRQFLVQHFKQHYETVVGSLLTWRQITDWTNEAALPPWVIAGTSA
jgi:hypothetical protein